MRKCGNDERMLDRARTQSLRDLVERHQLDFDKLAAFELLRFGLLRMEREKAVEVIVLDRGIWRDDAELAPDLGCVAGFFGELARSRCACVLARIAHAARDLETDLFDTDAILTEEN